MKAGSHSSAHGLIGPNAILQLVPVLRAHLGDARAAQICGEAGLHTLPDGSQMIPEADAARLHQAVRRMEPHLAGSLLSEAGERTATYILAHRIPSIAKFIIKVLPHSLSARLLSRAIAQHAWTFVGSGQFRAVSPSHFEIARNPLIVHERAAGCLCGWHTAVFTRLYRELVRPDATCAEISCGAQGDANCHFQMNYRLDGMRVRLSEPSLLTKESISDTTPG